MIVALYAFCVVFPVAGFAFSGNPVVPSCLTPVVQAEPVAHQHDAASHAHHGEGHQGHTSMAMAGDTGMPDHAGMDHPVSKSVPPACCGVMCVSALPANVFELMPRPVHHLSMPAFSDAGIPGAAPDLLYRPPIVLLSL